MDFPYPFDQTCFITGHRPQSIGNGWDDHPAHEICKRKLRLLILKAMQRGYLYFIDGMAVGTDIWCAEMICFDPEIVAQGAKLIAAVPFPGQEKAWKDTKAVALYRCILEAAHDSYTISLEMNISPQIDRRKWVSIALLQRNRWMVDRASLGIGLYDGSQNGGTFRAVEYARKLNRTICTYNPVSKSFERHDTQLSLISST